MSSIDSFGFGKEDTQDIQDYLFDKYPTVFKKIWNNQLRGTVAYIAAIFASGKTKEDVVVNKGFPTATSNVAYCIGVLPSKVILSKNYTEDLQQAVYPAPGNAIINFVRISLPGTTLPLVIQNLVALITAMQAVDETVKLHEFKLLFQNDYKEKTSEDSLKKFRYIILVNGKNYAIQVINNCPKKGGSKPVVVDKKARELELV